MNRYRIANYKLVRPVLKDGIAALQVDLKEVEVELFACKEQHMMHLHCSRYLNTPYRFYWRSTRLCYANPPFSQLAKALTKIALEGATVVMCTPELGSNHENAYWRPSLNCMTVGRNEIPDSPMYVSEDSQETIFAPEWNSLLSIVDVLSQPRISVLP